MKQYTPEKMAAQSRYRRYFPTLPADVRADVRADVYARVRELVEEERGALQLRAGLDEAVEHAAPLHVHYIGEKPRLCLLERIDVTTMVFKDRTRGLHVAHACQLQLEVDSVGLALGLELRDLVAQLLGRLCVPGSLCHLGFQRRDLLVTLRDGLLPIGAAHLLLPLRRLLLPEVFLGLRLFLRLVAMCITCHIRLPFSSADCSRRPAPVSFGYRL